MVRVDSEFKVFIIGVDQGSLQIPTSAAPVVTAVTSESTNRRHSNRKFSARACVVKPPVVDIDADMRLPHRTVSVTNDAVSLF